MKAILLKSFGGVENLYVGEVPKPEPNIGEVLIKVEATALNRADILQREGKYPPPKGESEIMGLEVAGTIERVGEGSTKFKEGDHVFALLAGGGYAEYVTVNESLVMPIPVGISFEYAAGIAEVFLTAFQALCWLANLQKGETVLIHAGASGVGTAAIQLVKALGGKSIVTAGSEAKIDFCQSLGASFGINYKTQPHFDELIKQRIESKGVNVIIDFIAGNYFQSNLNVMALDGRWVILAMMGGRHLEKVDITSILMKRIQLMGTTLRSRNVEYKAKLVKEFSSRFLPLFSSKQLVPIIDTIFEFENVKEAHQYMERNLNIGKIVLKVV